MMEYYELIKNLAFTGNVGIFTYWIPAVLCAIGYSARTWKQVHALKNYYSQKEKYGWVPDLTVGTVLWRVFLTVTPVVNVIALVFGLLSDMLHAVFDFVDKVLGFTLVKK